MNFQMKGPPLRESVANGPDKFEGFGGPSATENGASAREKQVAVVKLIRYRTSKLRIAKWSHGLRLEVGEQLPELLGRASHRASAHLGHDLDLADWRRLKRVEKREVKKAIEVFEVFMGD
jgi:hypothetical protein